MTYEECLEQLSFFEEQARHWRQQYENSGDGDGDGNPIDPEEQAHLDTIDNAISRIRQSLNGRVTARGEQDARRNQSTVPSSTRGNREPLREVINRIKRDLSRLVTENQLTA